MNPINVSQINYYIEEHMRTDPVLRKVKIIGEVANLKKTNQWAFFHLKDEKALLACISFDGLPNDIRDGNLVVATGAVRYYAKRGTLRLQVSEIAIENPSDRAKKRQEAESRYTKLGWFDRNRSFPTYPKRIGLITSKDGAAIDDVKRNIERRYPFAVLVVVPVLVQGLKAPILIAKAFQCIENQNLDCIILTRGGGDTSDLEVFDDERVVKAIVQCPLPVIAAIGHEKDLTFAELAADARASTPTGAAEFVVPTRQEIANRLRESRWKGRRLMDRHLESKSLAFEQAKTKSIQNCQVELEALHKAMLDSKRTSSRDILERIKRFNESLVAGRTTELAIENQWRPYQFYLQDSQGVFVGNNQEIHTGNYTLFGESHQQDIHIKEE